MPRFTTCEFINSNGRSCGSPAMRSRHFCYYHLRARPRARQVANVDSGPRTRRDLDTAVSKVMSRVMNEEITTQQAAVMVCALETAYENNTGLKAELV